MGDHGVNCKFVLKGRDANSVTRIKIELCPSYNKRQQNNHALYEPQAHHYQYRWCRRKKRLKKTRPGHSDVSVDGYKRHGANGGVHKEN